MASSATASFDRVGMPLFVYGTLRDATILGAVLGRRPPSASVAPAVAAGFRTVYAPGEVYPYLVPAPDHAAPGLLIFGLTPDDHAVLDRYEGTDYTFAPLTVLCETGPRAAWTYLPRVGVDTAAPAWSLSRGNAKHRPRVIEDKQALARWARGGPGSGA